MKKLTVLPPEALGLLLAHQSAESVSRRFQICYLTTGGCNQVLGLVLEYCQ